MNRINRIMAVIPEPAVTRPALMISAGIFWLIGATVLFYRGYEMLVSADEMVFVFAGIGLIVGAIKYQIVLVKTVRKNADRVREMAPHKDRVCIFAFQSLQAYILVLGMMGIGFGLRALFDYPKTLGTIYIGIGAALTLGALQYFTQARKSG